MVLVGITDINHIKSVQVNQLTVMHSSKPGTYLIGIITSIGGTSREFVDVLRNRYEIYGSAENRECLATIELIGTFYNRIEDEDNRFKKIIEVVPEVSANFFSLEGKRLSDFMEFVYKTRRADKSSKTPKLSIGRFIFHDNSIVYLDGNKLFQRHMMIAGSTGSGKSYTTALLLQQMSQLSNTNAVLFDIHGEYRKIKYDGVKHFRIAQPSDTADKNGLENGVIHLPYWLLEYDDFATMLNVGGGIRTAVNQEALLRKLIIEEKKRTLLLKEREDMIFSCTADSPVPFSIRDIIDSLENYDWGSDYNKSYTVKRRGLYYGKLSGLIERMKSRLDDHRLSFFFNAPDECYEMEWLSNLVRAIYYDNRIFKGHRYNIKIIDFSSVPSEIISLVANITAKILFNISRWASEGERHPVSIFCDEANLYIPKSRTRGVITTATDAFERIAKEGRKYGIGLVVICQRPSEINSDVLSQCNNLILMRLPYSDDQSAIEGSMPYNIHNFGSMLHTLGVGEAILIGDACPFPTPIQVTQIDRNLIGNTVDFWSQWDSKKTDFNPDSVTRSWCSQGMKEYPYQPFLPGFQEDIAVASNRSMQEPKIAQRQPPISGSEVSVAVMPTKVSSTAVTDQSSLPASKKKSDPPDSSPNTASIDQSVSDSNTSLHRQPKDASGTVTPYQPDESSDLPPVRPDSSS